MPVSVPKRKNENKHGRQAFYNELHYSFKVQQASYYQQYLITFSNLSLMQGEKKNKQWNLKIFPAE